MAKGVKMGTVCSETSYELWNVIDSDSGKRRLAIKLTMRTTRIIDISSLLYYTDDNPVVH